MMGFIHQQVIDDLSLCDRIVAFYQMSPAKLPGKTFGGVNTEIKKSTDCEFTVNKDLFNEYLAQLKPISDAYIEMFPECDSSECAWRITDGVNIQHYQPSEAYYGWHNERGTCIEPMGSRHLAFMTYLNDVDDAGETEFLYQGIKVQPRKGLTLIWPVDWTHTHRGIASPTKDKYIVTGWYNFVQE